MKEPIMATTQRRYRLIEITPGGVTGYHAPASRTMATHWALDEFVAHLADDGLVLDAQEAIDRDFRLVLRSPYTDPYLPPRTVTNSHGLSLELLEPVARAAWGASSGVMMDVSPTFPFTGFDTVSLDWYVDFWRAHGARVGRRGPTGELEWDEGGASAGAAPAGALVPHAS
jgi:hypothetical protein